jgi:hypothetical protein
VADSRRSEGGTCVVFTGAIVCGIAMASKAKRSRRRLFRDRAHDDLER